MSSTSTSTPTAPYLVKHWDGDQCYYIDTRLETLHDPTPRESEFNIDDLQEAFVAAGKLYPTTKYPNRKERIKRRDAYELRCLKIALEVYAKKNNMQPSDLHLVEVKERNLINEFGRGFMHFNFLVKGSDGKATIFFAELHPVVEDEKGVYLCTALKENDKAHCYGCKGSAKGLIHPNGGGSFGECKDVESRVMLSSNSNDDV